MAKIKTKKEHQSERTVTNIMDKSLILFARKGYYSTTLDDLANACGLTKGGLYCHFKTKEELFITVIKIEEGKSQHDTVLSVYPGGSRGQNQALERQPRQTLCRNLRRKEVIKESKGQ